MTQVIDMVKLKKAFNHIAVVRGQTVSIATVGTEGIPNVAPIGSARVVDDKTIHMLQGYLPRTIRNLESNPMATFLVTNRPGFKDLFQLFSTEADDIMGYRITARLTETSDSADALRSEIEMIRKRVPWFMRGAFRKFCSKNLKKLLTFTITEIRLVQ